MKLLNLLIIVIFLAIQIQTETLNHVNADYDNQLLPEFSKDKVRYWLMIGNSQMCGRIDDIEDSLQLQKSDYSYNPLVLRYGLYRWRGYDAAVREESFLFEQKKTWIPIESYMYFNSKSEAFGLGPADFLAHEITRRDSGIYFGAVCMCEPGSDWNSWTKKTADALVDKDTDNLLPERERKRNAFWLHFVRNDSQFKARIPTLHFNSCLPENVWCIGTEFEKDFGKWAGIVFIADGDSDPNGDTLVTKMVSDLREAIGDSTVPFITTQVPPWKNSSESVSKAIQNIAQLVRNARSVETNDLSPRLDGSHYDRNSCFILANRIADAWEQMNSTRTKKTTLAGKNQSIVLAQLNFVNSLHTIHKNCEMYDLKGNLVKKTVKNRGVYISIKKVRK